MPTELYLPEFIECENCNTKLKLDSSERAELKNFQCPHCKEPISAQLHYYEVWKPTEGEIVRRRHLLLASVADVTEKLDELKNANHQEMLLNSMFKPFFLTHMQMLDYIFVEGFQSTKIQFDNFISKQNAEKIRNSIILPGVLSVSSFDLSDAGSEMLIEGILELLEIENDYYNKIAGLINQGTSIDFGKIFGIYFLPDCTYSIEEILDTPTVELNVPSYKSSEGAMSVIALGEIYNKLLLNTVEKLNSN